MGGEVLLPGARVLASGLIRSVPTGESFPLRVGITTHNAAANRLTLPFLPRLGPVANGGFFFEKRRLALDSPMRWRGSSGP
jgi:hypothetical protein